MPKSTVACNGFLNLLYLATPWANIADNAAAAPITNIGMRLKTASDTPASTGATNEATYTNYAGQNVPRSALGWTVASARVISNAAAIEFPQCGVTGNTITSAATSKSNVGASDIYHYGDLNAPIAVSNQIQPRFPIGAVTITEA